MCGLGTGRLGIRSPNVTPCWVPAVGADGYVVLLVSFWVYGRGCGYGSYTHLMREYVGEVLGVRCPRAASGSCLGIKVDWIRSAIDLFTYNTIDQGLCCSYIVNTEE